jgi:site-specific recombinase XerD
MTRDRKRTKELMDTLPRGITIGHRKDGRPKPFFVRYGRPRKVESFATEKERNEKAAELDSEKEQHGTSVLNYDPAEWKEFQEWKATYKKTAMTVKDAVVKYMALRLAEDVVKDSDTHLHISLHLSRFEAVFGIRTLDSVTADDIRAWLASLKNPKTGEPMGKVTIKGHRKDVNTFFKRSVAEEWCRKNPCAVVKPPRLDDEEKVPLKPKEIFDLLKFNAGEKVIGKVVLELFGGMRASSAGRTIKDNINFAERGIAMPGQKHKSGKRKFRQGHPDVLWAWLTIAPDETWEIGAKNYAHLKSLAFVRARVKNPGNVLRDSFASYLLALTKDMGKVGYLMQHTRSSTTEGYEGIATEAEAKLVMAMTPEAVKLNWEEFLALK